MVGAEEETGTHRGHKIGQGAMVIGVLGRRQVMTRWENDPVWLHGGSRREIGQGQVQAPPQTEIMWREENGRAG